jgi:penicillin amidase/acyl-homoserine-lactone acylase
MTNRALRALELLGSDVSITREEFEAYKFDTAYSRRSLVAERVAEIESIPAPAGPLREAQELLGRWDLRTDRRNPAAALALLTLRPKDDGGLDLPVGQGLTGRDALLRRLEEAAAELKRVHGRLDVPWEEVNRLKRGRVDIGVGGAPDVLHAVYGRRDGPGHLRGVAGDSYVLLVEWDRQGHVSSRSLHQYGSATNDARSPHYADQAPLFAQCRLKPVWFEEADVRAHLEREYAPGDEAGRPASR